MPTQAKVFNLRPLVAYVSIPICGTAIHSDIRTRGLSPHCNLQWLEGILSETIQDRRFLCRISLGMTSRRHLECGCLYTDRCGL